MLETMCRHYLWFALLLLVPWARATAQPSDVPSIPAPAGIDRLHRSASPVEMFSEESLQQVAASVIADERSRMELQSQSGPKTNKPYWTVYAWLAAATIYDVESTFYRLNHCDDECMEANPIVQSFIERGRLETYAYSAAVNGIVMYVARRMYERGHPLWRVFPIALAVVHAVAGTLNLSLGAHGET